MQEAIAKNSVILEITLRSVIHPSLSVMIGSRGLWGPIYIQNPQTSSSVITLSEKLSVPQVYFRINGTSSYMAYAMWELTQGVPIWLKKFLLGPVPDK